MGENQGCISTSYSCGSVRGASCVGGLVGTAGFGSVVELSFWDVEVSGQVTSSGGTSRTTSEMQTAITFIGAGWDLAGNTADGDEAIWRIDPAGGYPCLTWEYQASDSDPNDRTPAVSEP